MVQQAIPVKITDPDRIPETFVHGPIGINMSAHFALLTFTNLRPDIDKGGEPTTMPPTDAVVRARLVIPLETLAQLRDTITNVLAIVEKKGGAATR
jgi:hypothetical protein